MPDDSIFGETPPNALGPSRKREPVNLPNLTPEENAKINASLVVPGGPRIPDAPDIAPAPEDTQERPVTDAEFFVGRRYRPHGRKSHTGATFGIVEHPKEPQHLAFDAERLARAKRKGLKEPDPSFYVISPRGTIGWVPWVGSIIAWPWEAAWEADRVEHGDPDPKPERKK